MDQRTSHIWEYFYPLANVSTFTNHTNNELFACTVLQMFFYMQGPHDRQLFAFTLDCFSMKVVGAKHAAHVKPTILQKLPH